MKRKNVLFWMSATLVMLAVSVLLLGGCTKKEGTAAVPATESTAQVPAAEGQQVSDDMLSGLSDEEKALLSEVQDENFMKDSDAPETEGTGSWIEKVDGENVNLKAEKAEISEIINELGLEARKDKIIPVDFHVMADFGIELTNSLDGHYILVCEADYGTTRRVILFGKDMAGDPGDVRLYNGTVFRIMPASGSSISGEIPLEDKVKLSQYKVMEQIRKSIHDDVVVNDNNFTVYLKTAGRKVELKHGDAVRVGSVHSFWYTRD